VVGPPESVVPVLAGLPEHLGPLTFGAAACVPKSRPLPFASVLGCDELLHAELDFSGPAIEHASSPIIRHPSSAGSAAEVVSSDPLRGEEIWRLLAASSGLRVIAGLFPSASQVPEDWTYSSMRLVMTAGTDVLTRGSAQGPLNAALQAFLTDTLKADGIAAVKGALELCGAGVALTGSIAAIDQVEQVFAGVAPADDMQVRHSVELAGPWSSPNYRAYQRSAGKGRWVPADRS
jgi:hypothetical protein